jgi:hypothetical protein
VIDGSSGDPHAGAMARRFRFRVRSGNALMSASNDPGTPGRTAAAGQEIVLSEAEAAQLLRIGRRSVDLIEVIEDESAPTQKRLPG